VYVPSGTSFTHPAAIEVLPYTRASASPRLRPWRPATHRFLDKPHRSTAGMVRYNHWAVPPPLVGGNGSTVSSSPFSHPILSSYPNFRAEHLFYLALITYYYYCLERGYKDFLRTSSTGGLFTETCIGRVSGRSVWNRVAVSCFQEYLKEYVLDHP
jgi:hypothetical protein